MSSFAYVIRHEDSPTGPSSWRLELDGRPLAQFGSLVAALDSAKSLHDIDGRGGIAATVDVSMAYGRFRVRWLDGQGDAICITDVSEAHDLHAAAPAQRGRAGEPRHRAS
jgi:hypothetical protein